MKRTGMAVLGSLWLVTLAGLPALAQVDSAPGSGSANGQPPGSVGYDAETKQWLYDTDGDSFPDLTEKLAGTDPADPDSNSLALINTPLSGGADKGERVDKVYFQQSSCLWPFNNPAPRLCITAAQSAGTYFHAISQCGVNYSRVCTYEDLSYLYAQSSVDYQYDPNGKWLGGSVQDDIVNCGNQSITIDNDPDMLNFDGVCNKWEARSFFCCHDKT
jgi:hypothetical protein